MKGNRSRGRGRHDHRRRPPAGRRRHRDRRRGGPRAYRPVPQRRQRLDDGRLDLIGYQNVVWCFALQGGGEGPHERAAKARACSTANRESHCSATRLDFPHSRVKGVQLRFSYRAYPTPGQQIKPAQAFGCARVEYNDALAARMEAFEKSERLSDAELSKRLTASKATPERAWLGEVSSVVLQPALADVNTAYRNFFAPVTGKLKGARIGPPRFRSRRDTRQAIRFTKNSRFAVTFGCKLRLPKIGEAKVAWSRELPSDPSSVTVIKDAEEPGQGPAESRSRARQGGGYAAGLGAQALHTDHSREPSGVRGGLVREGSRPKQDALSLQLSGTGPHPPDRGFILRDEEISPRDGC